MSFVEQEDVQFLHLHGAARADGVDVPEPWRFVVDPHDIDACEKLAGKIKQAERPPTALVCYNDWLAIAVMKAARNQEIDIPGQLSITGYDDLSISSLLQTPLTTVRFSRQESAEKIVAMLLSIVGAEGRTAVVQTRLIIRESTGKPKK